MIRFGTGGTPLSTKIITTKDGAKLSGRESGIYRSAELGLNHLEMEFVHGVRISEKEALSIKSTAKEKNITLSAHGSYYINLASKEKPKYHASLNRVKKVLWAGSLIGAKSITFHPAFYQGRRTDEVAKIVYDALIQIIEETKDLNNRPLISPETTGKPSQWGSLEEILDVAAKINKKTGDFCVSACIDFAHLHARSNGLYNSYEEFKAILKTIESKLGKKALKTLHMHISGINYGPKGEKNHLPLKESDLKYKELLQALHDLKVCGWVSCESPNLEEDALLLKKEYEKTSKT
ncbi:TIM barrel protein [Candidatus Dojkabacteria bacterium]|nr:TIM barrel protein [Candidatus Dojkabacteria bacterium]